MKAPALDQNNKDNDEGIVMEEIDPETTDSFKTGKPILAEPKNVETTKAKPTPPPLKIKFDFSEADKLAPKPGKEKK